MLKNCLARVVLGLTLAHCAGCGDSGGDVGTRQSASIAYGAGVDAFAKKDYPAACELLTQALDQGGLNSDLYADAMVKRAVCYGAAGKFDEALADLTKLEAGAPNLDQVFAARAFVLKKQGKVAEANAAMAKARQYNRMVKEFL